MRTSKEFFDELAEKMDELFPKGECQERGLKEGAEASRRAVREEIENAHPVLQGRYVEYEEFGAEKQKKVILALPSLRDNL